MGIINEKKGTAGFVQKNEVLKYQIYSRNEIFASNFYPL